MELSDPESRLGQAHGSEISLVNPGFLKTERVIDWLGGIEPVWMLLDFDSYCRLQRRPGEDHRAMHLGADLSAAEIAASPFVVNALTLLRMAEVQGSIKLTTSGNLARDVVTELDETCTWPTFDLELARSLTKVLNEADVWPLELLHRVAVEARLLRRKGRTLILAPNGRKALKAGGAQDLMSRLFEPSGASISATGTGIRFPPGRSPTSVSSPGACRSPRPHGRHRPGLPASPPSRSTACSMPSGIFRVRPWSCVSCASSRSSACSKPSTIWTRPIASCRDAGIAKPRCSIGSSRSTSRSSRPTASAIEPTRDLALGLPHCCLAIHDLCRLLSITRPASDDRSGVARIHPAAGLARTKPRTHAPRVSADHAFRVRL